MTLKAFMNKYNLNPALVTRVASITKHTATEERDVDYLEQDLVGSLLKILTARYDEAIKKAQAINKKISNVITIAHDSGLFN